MLYSGAIHKIFSQWRYHGMMKHKLFWVGLSIVIPTLLLAFRKGRWTKE